MTENQLNKLKNRLLNIQTQLNGASIVLEKGEPLINSKTDTPLYKACDIERILEKYRG